MVPGALTEAFVKICESSGIFGRSIVYLDYRFLVEEVHHPVDHIQECHYEKGRSNCNAIEEVCAMNNKSWFPKLHFWVALTYRRYPTPSESHPSVLGPPRPPSF